MRTARCRRKRSKRPASTNHPNFPNLFDKDSVQCKDIVVVILLNWHFRINFLWFIHSHCFFTNMIVLVVVFPVLVLSLLLFLFCCFCCVCFCVCCLCFCCCFCSCFVVFVLAFECFWYWYCCSSCFRCCCDLCYLMLLLSTSSSSFPSSSSSPFDVAVIVCCVIQGETEKYEIIFWMFHLLQVSLFVWVFVGFALALKFGAVFDTVSRLSFR